MTRYRIRHSTDYRYGAAISAGHTVAHLIPREVPGQRLLANTLTIDPEPDDRFEYIDVFGNPSTYFAISRAHDELSVVSATEIEVDEPPPWTGPTAAAWEEVVAGFVGAIEPEALRARQYRFDSPSVALFDELIDYARPSFVPGAPADAVAVELMHRIHHDFEFDADFSDVSTPLADVLAHRRGVCQDFAHLLIGCLRVFGLSARYVSGYLETDPPPGRPRLIGADASHAWCALFVPGQGWLDLDPTNDQVRRNRHVTIAWGRDYSDVAPLRGVVFGPPSTQELVVAVDVHPI